MRQENFKRIDELMNRVTFADKEILKAAVESENKRKSEEQAKQIARNLQRLDDGLLEKLNQLKRIREQEKAILKQVKKLDAALTAYTTDGDYTKAANVFHAIGVYICH